MKTHVQKTKLATIRVGKNVIATDNVEVTPYTRRIRITAQTTPEEANLYLVSSDKAELKRITESAKHYIKGQNLPETKKQELIRAIISLEHAKTKTKIENWTRKNQEVVLTLGVGFLIAAGILKGEQNSPKIMVNEGVLYGLGLPALLLTTSIAAKHRIGYEQARHRLATKLTRNYLRAGYSKEQTALLVHKDLQNL
jgi:hypothetical protein